MKLLPQDTAKIKTLLSFEVSRADSMQQIHWRLQSRFYNWFMKSRAKKELKAVFLFCPKDMISVEDGTREDVWIQVWQKSIPVVLRLVTIKTSYTSNITIWSSAFIQIIVWNLKYRICFAEAKPDFNSIPTQPNNVRFFFPYSLLTHLNIIQTYCLLLYS